MKERLAFGAQGASGAGFTHAISSGLDVPAFTGRGRGQDPPASSVADYASSEETRLERLDRLAYRGLLAFTFVLFFRPQDQLVFLSAIPLAEVSAIFALGALIWSRLGRGASITKTSPSLYAVIGLGAVMLLTAPFSIWPGGALAVFTDLYGKVVLIYLLMINTLTTRRRLEGFVSLVVLGTSYVAFRCVLDYVRGINLVEGTRATGFGALFANPNDMALNMVAFLPLAVGVALRHGGTLMRLIAALGLPFIAASIIFSKSRGGLLGLIVMLAVFLFQMRRVRPGVAAAVMVASLAAVPMLPTSFVDRMSSIFNPEEDPTGSREARKKVMRLGFEAFLAYPVTGLGAGQFVNYNPAGREEKWRETHNAVLQVASELGAVGLFLFVALLWSGLSSVRRASRAVRAARHSRGSPSDPATRARLDSLQLFGAAMPASLTGWLMAAMFASVAYFWTLYVMLGICAAYYDIAMREAGQAAPRRRWKAKAVAA